MKSKLQYIQISDFFTQNQTHFTELTLSYQLFGQPLGDAPVVLVNHALTGNSNVTGKNGWWSELIGEEKVIDTNVYTIIVFNIPGNGYDGFLIENYKDFVAADIAKLFLLGLEALKIKKLYAIIGASLGGGLSWEIVVQHPNITEHLIPIASDWKSTDWLIANCRVQEQFLENSKKPVHDARMHAMLCYRSPQSFKQKFQRSINDKLKIFNIESWLLHHGEKLQERFQLSAYKLMNQLLKTIDITKGEYNDLEVLKTITSKIHIIAVDSDVFFSAEENKETYESLKYIHPDVTYNEIVSPHGHDAFLIEYEKLNNILKEIFNPVKINKNEQIKA
ncbi:alpha/beta fold hydrolase [Flavobacteriaceae bacterium AU392]|nr:alpha/beta fold hydrolase [Flavobacteriaceae bacterium]RKM81547.1 alpha/beta fold hydrolase [Flavobacteriaceae bacterium AU392]